MLKLYGIGVSQPVRAVMWACGMNKLEYQLIYSLPYSDKFSNDPTRPRCDTHAKAFPSLARQIPVIDDNGFILAESGAILTYLANSRNWDNVYPSDPRRRALVDQYLHFHHLNTRSITFAMFMPTVHPSKVDRHLIEHHNYVAASAINHLETVALSDNGTFLNGSHEITLADIVAYTEVGQLKLLGLHDFAKLPRLTNWMTRMEMSEGYEDAHAALLAWRPTFMKLQKAAGQPS